jgi:hypothetical protein
MEPNNSGRLEQIVSEALMNKAENGGELTPFDLLRLLTTYIYSGGDTTQLKILLVIETEDTNDVIYCNLKSRVELLGMVETIKER